MTLKRQIGSVGAIGLLAITSLAGPAFASSHREAPAIAFDPSADITDLYAFVSPDADDTVTIIANYTPFQEPAGGPNFYPFNPDVQYWIKVDNSGDGVEDITYTFTFATTIANPDSFLYSGYGPIPDVEPNISQTVTVARNDEVIGTDLFVPPPNIGPRTTPRYGQIVANGIHQLDGGAGRFFAGQRDDPFFIDLGATFDGINIRKGTGNEGEGREDIAGTNTSAIVLQVPERHVTRNRRAVASPDARNSVVGVWASTDRRKLQVSNGTFDQRSPGTVGRGRGRTANRFVQVSRLGVPLVNELIIPLGTKDQFNRTTPDQDAVRYGKFVIKPELAAVLNALFKVNAPEDNRTDIVQALLQGLPGLNQHKGFAKGKAPAVDTLKLNLGTPPAAGAENRFGVIGGDMAGFPNGRRLGDDVVDIELQVVAGFLKGNKVPLGDGVDRNDKAFGDTFPYLALPQPGNDVPGRTEESHAPVPAGGS